MPSALYAISYKATASVLAVCSLEKQDLTSKKAPDELRTRLVGDKLTISMSTKTQQPLAIGADDLAADEIDIVDQAPLVSDPYAYGLVAQDPTQPVHAGDGTVKKVAKGSNSVTVALTHNGVLTVTFTNAPHALTSFGVLFEGKDIENDTIVYPDNSRTFQVGALTQNAYYAVIVVGTGIPTFAQMVIAT